MADYIEVTDLGLTPATTYYYKFQWKYADGTTSEFSAVKSITTAGDLKAQAPTLATGLTANTASFGVTISWDGTYASSAFTGFKSVNIYASTTNLGSSTTTNLTANLVGTMTVDQQANKISIGSTLLKNTLSLTSTTVYTTPIYFYFITVNSNNEVYKSGGVATYTRINSTGINPTQANIIDLQSGTISIENLVAGNGQFTEYMRIGQSGNARIELGANSVTTTGAGVTPGLSIYNSANQAVLSAPLSGGLTITGATVRSSTASNKIILDPTTDAISFYSTSGSGAAHIISSTDPNYPGITIHTGSTATSSAGPRLRMTKNLSGQAQGIYLWLDDYGTTGMDLYNSGSYNNVKLNGPVGTTEFSGQPQLRNIDMISSTYLGSNSLPTGYSGATEGHIIIVYTP